MRSAEDVSLYFLNSVLRSTARKIWKISTVADGANGNRHGCSGFRRSQHVAAPVEDSARIDDHARRVNLSSHHAFGLDLHASLRENHAVETAGDHHAIAFNLPFDLCAFAKDHGLFRDDVALYVAVNAERAGDRQRALEGYALVDESCPLFTCATLCRAGPLPCHVKTPVQRLLYFSCARG